MRCLLKQLPVGIGKLHCLTNANLYSVCLVVVFCSTLVASALFMFLVAVWNYSLVPLRYELFCVGGASFNLALGFCILWWCYASLTKTPTMHHWWSLLTVAVLHLFVVWLPYMACGIVEHRFFMVLLGHAHNPTSFFLLLDLHWAVHCMDVPMLYFLLKHRKEVVTEMQAQSQTSGSVSIVTTTPAPATATAITTTITSATATAIPPLNRNFACPSIPEGVASSSEVEECESVSTLSNLLPKHANQIQGLPHPLSPTSLGSLGSATISPLSPLSPLSPVSPLSPLSPSALSPPFSPVISMKKGKSHLSALSP